MKRLIFYFTMAHLCYFAINAQKLTLTDLTTLCSQKNWVDVNQSLHAKNWTYYDSHKGSSNKYNIIIWSFKKDYYSDQAAGWIHLYTYDEYPNKISYIVVNMESYSIILNSIPSLGFKFLNSEIEDNRVISTYRNTIYTLEISTEKLNDETISNTSNTLYKFTLITNASIFDPDNGKKTDTYSDGTTQAEYTLVNGKPQGEYKSYYENGNLEQTGNYKDGVKNGLFKEFDEYGILKAEYSLVNGKLQGEYKSYYENGNLEQTGNYKDGVKTGLFKEFDEYGILKAEYTMENDMINGILNYNYDGIKISATFKDDLKNGQYTRYYYDKETGELLEKYIGTYLNDKKYGTWKTYIIVDDYGEIEWNIENYSGDLKNGQFQELRDDSLIIGNYSDDKLHGEYKVYCTFPSLAIGIPKNPDKDCPLIVDGYYYENKKSGHWQINTMSSSEDEWSHFYRDEKSGLKTPNFFSNTEEGNYSNGQKTGEWKYYKWINEQWSSLSIIKKLFLIENYSNGKLDGISTRYSFLNEEEDPLSDINENKIVETFNYKNGELHGESIKWNNQNKPREIKHFNYGKLTKIVIYDSLGIKPQNQYEIYDELRNDLKCRKTEYYNDESYATIEYWVNTKSNIDYNWVGIMTAILTKSPKFSNGNTKNIDCDFKLFNSSNQPIVTGSYLRSEKIRLWTFYFYDQNIKIESNFVQDTRADELHLTLNGALYSGEFVYFDYENGTKEVRKIKNGLRNGKTIYTDINTGKTIKKESYKNGILK